MVTLVVDLKEEGAQLCERLQKEIGQRTVVVQVARKAKRWKDVKVKDGESSHKLRYVFRKLNVAVERYRARAKQVKAWREQLVSDHNDDNGGSTAVQTKPSPPPSQRKYFALRRAPHICENAMNALSLVCIFFIAFF